jgi:hypothetical protein
LSISLNGQNIERERTESENGSLSASGIPASAKKEVTFSTVETTATAVLSPLGNASIPVTEDSVESQLAKREFKIYNRWWWWGYLTLPGSTGQDVCG